MSSSSESEGDQIEESCDRVDDEKGREGVAGSRREIPVSIIAVGKEASCIS